MSEVYLAHHGILGQKWGVRRYQNANGSLTKAGKMRYEDYQTKMDYKNAKRDRKAGKEVPNYRDKQIKQLGTAAGKYFLNENSRIRAHENIDRGKSAVLSYAKAYIGTQIKDAVKSGAVGLGTAFITQNPQLGQTAAKDTHAAIKIGRAGRAIGQYVNMPKHDAKSEKLGKAKMYTRDIDTSTTKKVKSDFNNLSDKEFLRKYQVSKETYSKRVDKYGDPYARRVGI